MLVPVALQDHLVQPVVLVYVDPQVQLDLMERQDQKDDQVPKEVEEKLGIQV